MSTPRHPQDSDATAHAWDELQQALAKYRLANGEPLTQSSDDADRSRLYVQELISAMDDIRATPAAFAWWLYSAVVDRPAPTAPPRCISPDVGTPELVVAIGTPRTPPAMRLTALALLFARFDAHHAEQARELARLRVARRHAQRGRTP